MTTVKGKGSESRTSMGVSTVSEKASTNSSRPIDIPRGKPKSGRLWKTVRLERHSTIKKVKRFKSSWTERMEKKKATDLFKENKQRFKEEQANAKQLKRLRTEENKKRKLENQRKSEIVQPIKNTSKIKKMRKKQLRMIETR